jgi:3-vinyl bacteriochlorophyllide hydratase
MSLLYEGQATNRELYTKEQRQRRDSTKWTIVQGILAPVQFFVFLISVILVVRYLATGEGYAAATISIILKTLVLYTIMITGAIWEKVVFGQYLLAPGFFWEDVVSFFVIGLHTLYLLCLFNDLMSSQMLMVLALSAYFIYIVNALQFLLKLRMARLQHVPEFTHA